MTAFVCDDALTGLPVHHPAGLNFSFERRHGVKPPADFFGREIDRPEMAPVPSSRGLLTR